MIAFTQSSLRTKATVAMVARHFIAHGVPFQLRAPDSESLAVALDLLPFGTRILASATSNSACFTLPTIAHRRFPTLLARLEQQVLLQIAVHAPHRTFLHAGVVGWQGRTIVLPGASHAGKSTLVSELVKLGAVYYSDEYALLDSSGMVHPYARDLRMRAPGNLHQTQTSPASLSGVVADTPAVVAHVILTEFVPGAEWNPQPLTRGAAVLGMLPHCVSARRHPADVLRTLKELMRTAQACRTARGEARATAQLLLQTLSSAELPA